MVEAVLKTLTDANKPLKLEQIRSQVKEKVPELCDDSLTPCPWCRQKHPKWHHEVAWALQELKRFGLAEGKGRGVWQATSKGLGTRRLPLSHKQIKEMLFEIGKWKGRIPMREHRIDQRRVDVVWKKVKEGAPYAVFEVEIKGNLFEALAKLKHAWDMWNARIFIVTPEEKFKEIKELVKGSFHEIRGVLGIVSCVQVRELHEALRKVAQIEKNAGLEGL